MVYVPNPNFEREFDPSGQLVAAAEAVKPEANRQAPRIRPRGPEACEVVVDDAGVRLVNSDYGGVIAEFGSAKSPAYAPLRRSAQTAGLRLEESSE